LLSLIVYKAWEWRAVMKDTSLSSDGVDGASSASAADLDAVERGAARRFTSKQMGDACEMLVAAELTLAGIPALKVPDNWPHYDVIAQPLGRPAQRISVKSRTFKTGPAYVEYNDLDRFDWLAIVLVNGTDCSDRAIYLIPRAACDRNARRDKATSRTAHLRYYRIDEVDRLFSGYRGNYSLSETAVDERQ
jgi:hypothetical protein